MSWYRRAKLFLASSRRNIKNAPRISPISPRSNAFSTVHGNGSSNLSAKFSGFSIFSRKSGLSFCNSLGNTNINACNRFLSIPKKFDCVDRHQVRPFKPPEERQWLQDLAAVLATVLVSSGVLVTVYWNLETVPYSQRGHFVLRPKSVEKWVDELRFQHIEYGFQGRILPADHPDSIRVKSIVKNIIEGMQRSLSLESVGYASTDGTSTENDEAVKDTPMGLSGMQWSQQEEIVDEVWIQQSRKNGKEKGGSQPSISHLEGLDWEVIVVKGRAAKAYCFSSGKIVVYTGLLKDFKTDAEIATVIGPEIGSVVARHLAEETSYWFCLVILLLFLCPFVTEAIWTEFGLMVALFLLVPWMILFKANTTEADRIGLILQAAAGYDPRVVLGVYLKLGRERLERAAELAESNAIEEALLVYRRKVESDRLDLERAGE